MSASSNRRVVRHARILLTWAAIVAMLGLAPLSPAVTTVEAAPSIQVSVQAVPQPAPVAAYAMPLSPDVSGPSGISAPTPTFTWKAVSGSVAGYLVYDLASGKDVNVYQTYTAAAAGCPNAGATCSAPSPSALSAGSHQVWVIAYNGSGWGAWSSPLAFCVTACSAGDKPAAPVLTAPTNTIATDLPTFRWNALNPAPTGYALYDIGPNGQYDVVWALNTSAICLSGVCSAAPSQRLAVGPHTFYVIAYNAEGWGTWSQPLNFCITGCAPFDSQFNTDVNGWSPITGTWTLGGGAFSTSGEANKFVSIAHSTVYADVDYQAKLTRTGCLSCTQWLLLRGTPTPLSSGSGWNSGYAFGYTASGLYVVWKDVSGVSGPIQNFTATSAINQGSGVANILRVLTHGRTMVYYINDVPVWSGSDPSLEIGQVGINMFRDGTTGNSLAVDWARVSFPSPAAQAAVRDVQVSAEQQARNDAANQRRDAAPNPNVAPARP